eukprot:scaffold271762_cov31-Tisochrysis_lutea.AAC.3
MRSRAARVTDPTRPRHLKEGRLAHAVGADEGDSRFHIEAQVDILEEELRSGRRIARPRHRDRCRVAARRQRLHTLIAHIAECHVIHLQDWGGERLGRRELKAKCGVRKDLRERLHATERLDSRLDHLGAVGVGTELGNERIHVRSRFLLRLGLPLVVSDLVGARALKVVVVSLVSSDALRLEVQNVSHHGVEERACMRDHN